MTLFDWNNYLSLARSLASQNTEEAQRSAISRAYYAVFCLARNHLQSKGIVAPETGEAHKFVWDRFSNARRECRIIGITGSRLLRKRRLADYENEFLNLLSETEGALLDAEDALRELKNKGNACP